MKKLFLIILLCVVVSISPVYVFAEDDNSEASAAAENIDIVFDESVEEIQETAAETIEVEETSEPAEEDKDLSGEKNEPAAQESQNAEFHLTVVITGTQKSAAYDGKSHKAEGYGVTEIRCEVVNAPEGETVKCPSYGSGDFNFSGKAEAVRTVPGIEWMGLNADQFENTKSGFASVTFDVTDGFIEITGEIPAEVIEAEPEDNGNDSTAPDAENGAQDVSADGSEENNDKPILVINTNIPADSAEENETPSDENTGNDGTADEPADPADESETPSGENAVDDGTADAPAETADEVETPSDENIMKDGTAGAPADPAEENETPADENAVNEGTASEPAEPADEGETSEEGAVSDEAADDEELQAISSDDAQLPEGGEQPAADAEAELNDPAEGSGEEPGPQVLTLSGEISIYADPDEAGEPLLISDGDVNVTVLESEGDWLKVQLPDGTIGYVPVGNMPESEAEEPVEEQAQTVTVKSATDIRMSADGMSEIIFTTDSDLELTILEIEGDWIKVQLADGTIGYIFASDLDELSEPEETLTIAEPVKKVTIFTSRRSQMRLGESISLTSRLEGFEGCTHIAYQWECDKGGGFEPVDGGDGPSYSFSASKESLSWSWRLTVFYK